MRESRDLINVSRSTSAPLLAVHEQIVARRKSRDRSAKNSIRKLGRIRGCRLMRDDLQTRASSGSSDRGATSCISIFIRSLPRFCSWRCSALTLDHQQLAALARHDDLARSDPNLTAVVATADAKLGTARSLARD